MHLTIFTHTCKLTKPYQLILFSSAFFALMITLKNISSPWNCSVAWTISVFFSTIEKYTSTQWLLWIDILDFSSKKSSRPITKLRNLSIWNECKFFPWFWRKLSIFFKLKVHKKFPYSFDLWYFVVTFFFINFCYLTC